MNHYIWWTWPGWGETAYPISRYIERSHAGPVTVAFDYLEPFYKPPGQRWVKADFYKCQSTEELARSLEELRAQSVDLLIVSKNKSNRQWCLNRILLRMRQSCFRGSSAGDRIWLAVQIQRRPGDFSTVILIYADHA